MNDEAKVIHFAEYPTDEIIANISQSEIMKNIKSKALHLCNPNNTQTKIFERVFDKQIFIYMTI